MTPGTTVRIARGAYFVGKVGTVVSDYRSPFGPSVLVRFADGSDMAVRISVLDIID
jgi:hypothetical protein